MHAPLVLHLSMWLTERNVFCRVVGSGHALAVNRLSFETHSRDEAFFLVKHAMEEAAQETVRVSGQVVMIVMVAIDFVVVDCRAHAVQKGPRTDRGGKALLLE